MDVYKKKTINTYFLSKISLFRFITNYFLLVSRCLYKLSYLLNFVIHIHVCCQKVIEIILFTFRVCVCVYDVKFVSIKNITHHVKKK